jgi:zinc protease
LAEPASAFTLANGLQVVVLPDHRLPIVTHIVYYRAGSADDPPGESGIAHFTEHLMFKGTKRYPTGQYDLYVTRAGGTNNAFTSNDKTYFYEQILKEGLPRIMDLDADRMADLDFAPLEAEHELKVVLEERRSYINDPESVLAENTTRALYESSAYAHPVLGEPAETGALTLAAVLDFHARFYAPANAILIVAGDVEPEVVHRLAEATYGKVPGGSAPAPREFVHTSPACAKVRVEERHQRVPRDKFSLYFLTPGAAGMGVRTQAALGILADILQDQGGSPLWQQLVVKEGIASDVAAGFELKMAAGEFSISAAAEQAVTAKRLEAALEEGLVRLRRTGVDASALAEAKRRKLTERLLNADDQLGEATRYGDALAIARTLAEIEDEPKTIAAVTLADVNAVLHDLLSSHCYVSASLERDGPAAGPADRGTTPRSTSTVH